MWPVTLYYPYLHKQKKESWLFITISLQVNIYLISLPLYKPSINASCFNTGNTLTSICHGELKPSPLGTEVKEVLSHCGTQCHERHWYSAPVLISHWTWKRSRLPLPCCLQGQSLTCEDAASSRSIVGIRQLASPKKQIRMWSTSAQRPTVSISTIKPPRRTTTVFSTTWLLGRRCWSSAKPIMSHNKECTNLEKGTEGILRSKLINLGVDALGMHPLFPWTWENLKCKFTLIKV